MNNFKPIVKQHFKNKYIDFQGAGCLDNGTCRIQVPQNVLEIIHADTDDTPWLVFLTPYGDLSLYVAEIGTDYFIVRTKRQNISGVKFMWTFSAVLKTLF